MINKIICWIFGHIIREKYYKEETINTTQLWTWQFNKVCPRCGSNLA